MKLLIWYTGLADDLIQQIREVAATGQVEVVTATGEEEAVQMVTGVEILFGRSSRKVVQCGEQLRWIQPFSAGMDGWIYPETIERGIVITNAAGVFAIHVAEHAFALLLSLTRGISSFVRNQLEHTWGGRHGTRIVEVSGGTLGIIGLGGIGTAIAQRGKAFEMRVLAIDPVRTGKPPFVDELWKPHHLDDFLGESDVVMIAAPHTAETDKLIGKKQFSMMKRTSYLVNISRGKIVDQAALIEALKAGWIAGAGLDVCEEEPLPPESELWEMENVVITPHAAGGSQRRHKRMVDFFCENLKRYLNGEPLLNVVDQKRGF
ncbi:MAG: D-2-hydroxyacid dehydrogenase [Candidatus Latescibacteria bacterium]|nr:D-2-hydroxyacid dehydrogenase [Candidatus Latescibacterota bacterium]